MPEALVLDADAVLWSTDRSGLHGRHLLLLLHGYGADEHDLYPLRQYLPDTFVVASLAAPLAPPWPAPGRSWYPIEGLEGRDASHVTRAARAVIAWIDEHAAGAASVGLLGFSQGGAVSLQAMRLDPPRFAYAVNLSGYATPGNVLHRAHFMVTVTGPNGAILKQAGPMPEVFTLKTLTDPVPEPVTNLPYRLPGIHGCIHAA